MKLIVLLTLFITAFAHNKKALEIHFFEVGNADSQLVVFPSGYSILIDCGDYDWENASNTKHVAKRIEEILGHKNQLCSSQNFYLIISIHQSQFDTFGKIKNF